MSALALAQGFDYRIIIYGIVTFIVLLILTLAGVAAFVARNSSSSANPDAPKTDIDD